MNYKYKQVVFHFGSHKTGSSSIQKTFNEARQLLLEKGVLAYPAFRHGELGSYFSGSSEKFELNVFRGVSDSDCIKKRDELFFKELNQWIKETPNCDTLLFSFEGFWAMDKQSMQRMKDFASSLAPEVKVVLYSRPPLSLIVSRISQHIKFGKKVKRDSVWPFRSTIEKIVSIFAAENFYLRVFSPKILKNQSVVDDFADFLGFSPELIQALPKVYANQSLSVVGEKLAQALIDYLREHAIEMSHIDFFKFFGRLLADIPGDKIKLSKEEAQKIIKAFQPEHTFLKKEFSIDLSEDMNKYIYSSEDALQAEKMVAAFSKILKHLGSQISVHKQRKQGLLSSGKQKFASYVKKVRAIKQFKKSEEVV